MDESQTSTYMQAGADGSVLMPLRKWDETATKHDRGGRPKVIKLGKHPLAEKWKGVVYPLEKIKQRVDAGHNVGYRIRPGEIVVDMDPRDYEQGKEEVQEWVAEALGVFDFDDVLRGFPTVKTGGGGYHIYLKTGAIVDPKGWNEQVKGHKGVEFKKQGKYVVCAGSRHPDEGKEYKWVNGLRLQDSKELSSSVVRGLEDLLKKRASVVGEYTASDESWRVGVFTPEQLKKWVLNKLDVTAYKTREEWLRVCFECHHATGALGEEEFVEWSLGDPEFEDDEAIIRKAWHSSTLNGGNKRNAWSLLVRLREQGVKVDRTPLSRHLDAIENEHTMQTDFSGLVDDGEGENEDRVESFFAKEAKDGVGGFVPVDSNSDLGKRAIITARAAAECVAPSTSGHEVEAAIRMALCVDDLLIQFELLDNIQRGKGCTKDVFKHLKRKVEESMSVKIEKDLPRVLAELALEDQFYNGTGLMYSIGEQIWAYNGMCWSVVAKKWVEKKITCTLDKMKRKIKIKQKENALINEASSIILRLAAVNEDYLGLKKRPKAVINCLNGEYWIDEGVLKPHRPGSHLLQVLNIKYDDWADCPKFDALLDKTFERFPDREAKKRFLYQMIGYIIYPRKELDRWFMFYGSGGDGKSTIINIIMALLGDAVLPINIKDFEGNHTMSAVPGKLLIVDEDMDARVKLPDGTLKKLSGHTQLSCDPKHDKREYFSPACTVLLCTNTLPITDDVTEAARRRPIVYPFDQDFHKDGNGGVKGIDRVIIEEELPGLVIRSMEALDEVLDKDAFDIPKSSIIATNNFIQQSNMIAMFMADNLEQTNSRQDTVLLVDAYERYVTWCASSGIKKPSGKQPFRQGLEAMGLNFDERLTGGKRGFRCVLMKGIEEFD